MSQTSSPNFASSISNFESSFNPRSSTSSTLTQPKSFIPQIKVQYLDDQDTLLKATQTIFESSFVFVEDISNERKMNCRLMSIQMFYEKFLERFEKKVKELIWLKFDSLQKTLCHLDVFRRSLYPGQSLCQITVERIKGRRIGDYFEHFVEVQDLINKRKKWGFYMRYSKIAEFHQQVLKELGRGPRFPSKKLFGRLEETFLEGRSLELTNYFNELLENRVCLEKGTLKNFLSLNCEEQIITDYRKEFKALEWEEIISKTFVGNRAGRRHFFEILKTNTEFEMEKMSKLCDAIATEICTSERNHSIEFFMRNPIRTTE